MLVNSPDLQERMSSSCLGRDSASAPSRTPQALNAGGYWRTPSCTVMFVVLCMSCYRTLENTCTFSGFTCMKSSFSTTVVFGSHQYPFHLSCTLASFLRSAQSTQVKNVGLVLFFLFPHFSSGLPSLLFKGCRPGSLRQGLSAKKRDAAAARLQGPARVSWDESRPIALLDVLRHIQCDVL